MYEIQDTMKIFIPCVFNRKKLMSLSPAGASCKQHGEDRFYPEYFSDVIMR